MNYIYKWVILAWVSMVLVSCKHDSTTYNVFKYNQNNNINSLDPAFAKSQNNIWPVHHLFDGLVQLDDSLHVVPCIAKSWEVIGDTSYTFNLRRDVFFHDDPCFPSHTGRRLMAQDVVYSLTRLVDPKVHSTGSWIFGDHLSKLPFQAPNDSTFVINLNRAYSPLLSILTMQYCSILPREAVEFYGSEFSRHPVGTGPFKFKRWEDNEALYLVRNSKYFDQISTNLDGIKTSFIPDRKVAYLEVLNGNIDFVSGLESDFVLEWVDSTGRVKDEYKNRIKFYKSPYLNTEYIGINTEASDCSPWLKIKEFRQALNYSIDKREMLGLLRNGIGKPATNGIIPPGLPGYNNVGTAYQFNSSAAKSLLQSINFQENKDSPLILYTNQDYLDICTYVVKQWEKIGITAEINLLETSILRSKMRNGEIALFRASWIADYPDAESFLCMFYSKNPAPPNYTRYKNPEYDELYQSILVNTDEVSRIREYQKMDKILINDAPVIFLFYDETALFTTTDIQGVSNNALNLLEVKNLVKR
ncbi:MAG TPA: ABC transporter substrate-binding protein [Saprospiraceae bacterium]|nr:ABC transporter substrate-binding protein [Saprospiraceae bacterium]